MFVTLHAVRQANADLPRSEIERTHGQATKLPPVSIQQFGPISHFQSLGGHVNKKIDGAVNGTHKLAIASEDTQKTVQTVSMALEIANGDGNVADHSIIADSTSIFTDIVHLRYRDPTGAHGGSWKRSRLPFHSSHVRDLENSTHVVPDEPDQTTAPTPHASPTGAASPQPVSAPLAQQLALKAHPRRALEAATVAHHRLQRHTQGRALQERGGVRLGVSHDTPRARREVERRDRRCEHNAWCEQEWRGEDRCGHQGERRAEMMPLVHTVRSRGELIR
ncbi:hypothetical protein FGB62_86g07 [Gracilaria domingensis]|nr:hypothetical protein FGB62_86g07 [Gracilaria domingensis]